MKTMCCWIAIAALAMSGNIVHAQDSVDVTFRYINALVSGVTLPGEFNGWNNSAYPMSNQGGGLWTRTVRLRVGGNPSGGVPGAWQYKFYYSGAGDWPNDPLNHHFNPADNNNSYIYTRDPTLYQILPNQRQALITTSTPTISVYIFPKLGATVDTSTIQVIIDGVVYDGLGESYNAVTHQLVTTLESPIPNGGHTMVVKASSSWGTSSADTVTFTTLGGYAQFLTQGGYATLSTQRSLRGIVQDTTVSSVTIIRVPADTITSPVSHGTFTVTVNLLEGVNTFRAVADSAGTPVASSPVTFTRKINHAPSALISFVGHGSTIDLTATGSTDPDTGQAATLTYVWSEDAGNPETIGGVNGQTSSLFTLTTPTIPGEYYFRLIAADENGNRDTTRNYFTVANDGSATFPTLASVPLWVRQGRMYSMFFKMHTAAGTINAALPDLDRLAAMGYNIIWVLPIMKNHSPINNGSGPGYDIVDFTMVAPEYGTNDDMRNFVSRAHQLGMKVILDITPNHSSAGHPFVLDARLYKEASRYWTYYQHVMIPYSGTGWGQLSESITGDGFVYYNGFSDELLNYNWADVDARQYMIDVYKYWVQDIGADGYRFDVYWGPHIRTPGTNGGESQMGQPVRAALKHVRPDLNLLGEAMGTGVGTEAIYADYQGAGGPGGVDEAYDWILKDYVQGNVWTLAATTRVNDLDARLRNGSANNGMGYVPGPNSYFLRFLENHDEDRVIYKYGTSVTKDIAIQRTMPMSTAVNLAVGMPMVYAGQEVGRGYGISDFDVRRRGVVDFTDPAGITLMPHYQKLAQIKKQFACFWTQSMVLVTTDVTGVYAYTRPSPGLNGVVVANLDAAAHTVNVTLNAATSPSAVLGVSDGKPYWATDLYNNDSTKSITFTGGSATLTMNLPAYGSAVWVIDTVQHTLQLPSLTGVAPTKGSGIPESYGLSQNYPNPFNPTTAISYQVSAASNVKLVVYDVLGREVAVLVNERKAPGRYEVSFDASGLGTGVYFCRMTSDGMQGRALVRKMLLLK